MKSLPCFSLVIAVVLASCGFSIRLQEIERKPPISDFEPFAVVEEPRTLDTNTLDLVAKLVTRNSIYGGWCDYPSLLDTVSNLARRLGANIIRVDQHLYPTTFGSGCHSMEASLYRAADATPHEVDIVWHKDRKLTVDDFRGDTAQRPFTATTSCGIRYSYYQYRFTRVLVRVETFFDHDASYFKTSDDDEAVLRHEQLHFDIAEIHARTLRKKLMELSCTSMELDRSIRDLHKETMRQLQLEQDRYDADTYSDPSRLGQWKDYVAVRLASLDAFNEIELHMVLNNKPTRVNGRLSDKD